MGVRGIIKFKRKGSEEPRNVVKGCATPEMVRSTGLYNDQFIYLGKMNLDLGFI